MSSLYFVLHCLECKIQRQTEKLRSSSSPCRCFDGHFHLDCGYYLCVLEHPENLGGLQEHLGDSLVAQSVKSLPAMWETWTRSLGWEDPLEKEMATHSSILAWRIPWTEEQFSFQSQRKAVPKNVQTTTQLHSTHVLLLLLLLSRFSRV